jgi:DNA polymerase
VRPELVVVLGATAAKGIVGPKVRVTRQRGEVVAAEIGPVGITIHPSAVLRAPTEEARRVAYEGFVADLRRFGSR